MARKFLVLNVSHRFMLVLATGCLTPTIVLVMLLIQMKSALIEQRSLEVRHLDESAWTLVNYYHDRYLNHQMTESDAKSASINAVRAMRYDATNYYFIWDLKGVGVAHGGNQQFEGRNYIDGPEAAKRPNVSDMVRKLVDIAKDRGEGLARYYIPKAGQTIPLDKIGYSKIFKPWGWSIGTGAYVTDIDAIFYSKAEIAFGVTAGAAAAALILSYWIGNELASGLKRLSDVIKRLASGDLTIAVPFTSKSDEVGQIANAVDALRLNTQRLQALEREQAAAESASVVVTTIAKGLERVASGDLAFRLEEDLPPSFESLRTHFNDALNRLMDLVQSIVGNMSAMQTGTGRISVAADDLLHQSEQQADSLNESNTALRQISFAAKRTVDRSAQAKAVMDSARAEASGASARVRDAVQTMDQILRSTANTVLAAGVIDGLASRTNLVALNATIEAARAGAREGGFGVVAAEIRDLARQASEAARQIGVLTTTNSTLFKSAVDTVVSIERTLEALLATVNNMTDAFSEISDAARDQFDNIGRLDHAFTRIDTATRSNVAMAMVNTEASRDLSRDADGLVLLTRQFRIAAA